MSSILQVRTVTFSEFFPTEFCQAHEIDPVIPRTIQFVTRNQENKTRLLTRICPAKKTKLEERLKGLEKTQTETAELRKKLEENGQLY